MSPLRIVNGVQEGELPVAGAAGCQRYNCSTPQSSALSMLTEHICSATFPQFVTFRLSVPGVPDRIGPKSTTARASHSVR
jgi:hypothetical protein